MNNLTEYAFFPLACTILPLAFVAISVYIPKSYFNKHLELSKFFLLTFLSVFINIFISGIFGKSILISFYKINFHGFI